MALLLHSTMVLLLLCLVSYDGLAQAQPNRIGNSTKAPSDPMLNDSLFTGYHSSDLDSGDSGFIFLSDALDAFVARALIIDDAQVSIDFKTFIFKSDAVGKAMLDAFWRAAERGVRVRLLVDDVWSDVDDATLMAYDAHPRIEIRIFNPLTRTIFRPFQFVTRFGTLTRRMHNKALISDGLVAVSGGRNIAEEYFDLKPELKFVDLDVLSIGPVVYELAQSFDQFWINKLALPVSAVAIKSLSENEAQNIRLENSSPLTSDARDEYLKAAKNSNLAMAIRQRKAEFGWGRARVLADSADKISSHRNRVDLHLAGEIRDVFNAAEREIVIITPYFLPGTQGLETFTNLIKKGVRVVIITNSLASNNHGIVHAHYAKYRKPLLAAGVDIYELRRKSIKAADKPSGEDDHKPHLVKDSVLHTKLFLFDRSKIFVGSLNIDPRSITENTEIGILLNSTEFGAEFGQWVDQDIGVHAYKLELENNNGKSELIWVAENGDRFNLEPDTSLWLRFKTRVLSLLPIESFL